MSPFSADRLEQLWARNNESLLNAAKLAAYCRTYGSVVGFGIIPGVPTETAFRIELVHAMETFAIAHEVGHCYFEEKHPGKQCTPSDEYACDLYALPISRGVGNKRSSWAAFTGAGAYTFLRSAAISLGEDPATQVVITHPYARDRAKRLAQMILATIHPNERTAVGNYLGDFETLFDQLDRILTRTSSQTSG